MVVDTVVDTAARDGGGYGDNGGRRECGYNGCGWWRWLLEWRKWWRKRWCKWLYTSPVHASHVHASPIHASLNHTSSVHASFSCLQHIYLWNHILIMYISPVIYISSICT
ncbi:hypothetical protein Rs2_43513 [Raphanus sativus]|nr:hypothetical protein Rs2_43513 [Raphanus sativus]